MNSKCFKLSITGYILVEDDDGSITEIATQPIIVYRGTEFDYDSISKLEELAIQRVKNGRSGENKSNL